MHKLYFTQISPISEFFEFGLDVQEALELHRHNQAKA